VLFASSNPRAFVVLRQSLISEKKSWIVERIDTTPSTITVSQVIGQFVSYSQSLHSLFLGFPPSIVSSVAFSGLYRFIFVQTVMWFNHVIFGFPSS